jgi:hypothetical protein
VTASDDGALRAGAGLRPVDWLVAVPDVASRLRRQPPDRVLVLRGDLPAPRLGTPMDVVVAVGLLTDEARERRPGLLALRSAVSRLLDSSGLAVLDSPVPLQQSTAQPAGFAHAQRIGESAFGCPAYLLRR